jgi:multidrug efflux pump
MVLSVLVALILSPSLCATILKPTFRTETKKGFFGWFNRNFNRFRNGYTKSTGGMISRSKRFFLIYLLLIVGLVFIFIRIPTSFLPNEDQGVMYLTISTPPASSAETTLKSVKEIEDYFLDKEQNSIDHLFTVVGFSFAGRAQNSAFGFVGLKDWSERENSDQSVFALAGRSMGALSQVKGARAFAFYPPPIRELGNASGFDMQLVDRSGLGHEALMEARNQILFKASQNSKLIGVRPNGLSDVPQYKIDINTEKAMALGLKINDINDNLQTVWGSKYVNDFIDKGRIKKVYLQGEAPYRMLPEDVNRWYVKNDKNQMIPFDSFSTSKWEYGSPKLERFNGNSTVNIQGSAAPGVSSGDALDAIEGIVKNLPNSFDLAWKGLSYEERLSGSQTTALYILSIIAVFLSLAALYESWLIPFSVILIAPLGILGAAIAASITGMSNDIYFQVGLLTTIGLAARNAILIVEFAKTLHEQGHEITEAITMAAKQRFRPVIMTSMAFILGVTPLAIANGAGSASQNAIGITMMGGMIAASTLVILFVPMFYAFVQKNFSKKTI